MPTYRYRTIPPSPDRPVREFDVRQAMSDPPLTHDPDSGEAVERIITGGRGPLTPITGGVEPTVTGGCGPSCGCH